MKTKDKKELEIGDISNILFESAVEGLIVADISGYIRIVNPRIIKMFGYKKKELVGQKVEILIPEEHWKKHIHHRKEYNKAPTRRSMGSGMDLSGRKKDGSTFPIEISLNNFTFEGNQMIMVLISEITKRKEAIGLLQKEKKTAQTYLDIAGTMFVVINKDKKVELINKRGCELLGYEEEEIIGKNWFENFLPKDLRKEVSVVFEKLMKGNTTDFDRYENPILTKHGKELLISWSNTTLKDDDGNIIGTLGSGEDITKQRQAEDNLLKLNTELEKRVEERTRALEDSQRLYKLIARNFPNGVISVFDKDLNYVFVEGMEMFKRGITGEMLIGTSFLKRIDPKIRKDIKQKLMATFEGENANFELETDKKTFMINAVGLHNIDNEIDEILMVSQNITSLKKAEQDTQRSLEKEIHLNELKSRFVSMASHEFRTPLTSVMNSVSLLSKYIGTHNNQEKQQKHISRIKTSIHYLTNILNDFLSLDKLEQGKLEMICSEFDLPEFSREVVDEVMAMAKKGQQINYEHSGEKLAYLDQQMLKNIYNNLLSNAIKYSAEDCTIGFKTKVNKGMLTVNVKDQGIGIPEDEQKNLFERFFRAKNATNIQGTGLGLNIVKKYLDIAGGSIKFKSATEKGTTFTVKLPASKAITS